MRSVVIGDFQVPYGPIFFVIVFVGAELRRHRLFRMNLSGITPLVEGAAVTGYTAEIRLRKFCYILVKGLQDQRNLKTDGHL